MVTTSDRRISKFFALKMMTVISKTSAKNVLGYTKQKAIVLMFILSEDN
jgi:hypothetical protein